MPLNFRLFSCFPLFVVGWHFSVSSSPAVDGKGRVLAGLFSYAQQVRLAHDYDKKIPLERQPRPRCSPLDAASWDDGTLGSSSSRGAASLQHGQLAPTCYRQSDQTLTKDQRSPTTALLQARQGGRDADGVALRRGRAAVGRRTKATTVSPKGGVCSCGRPREISRR